MEKFGAPLDPFAPEDGTVEAVQQIAEDDRSLWYKQGTVGALQQIAQSHVAAWYSLLMASKVLYFLLDILKPLAETGCDPRQVVTELTGFDQSCEEDKHQRVLMSEPPAAHHQDKHGAWQSQSQNLAREQQNTKEPVSDQHNEIPAAKILHIVDQDIQNVSLHILADELADFTPQMLKNPRKKVNLIEYYCAARLWADTGLFQQSIATDVDTAKHVAKCLALSDAQSVRYEDAYSAITEPWKSEFSERNNGRWDQAVSELMQDKMLGRIFFKHILLFIRDRQGAMAGSELTKLEAHLQQWQTSDVTKQLEKQFLLKELRIGKRSQEFPTWMGLISSAVDWKEEPMWQELPAPAPPPERFCILFVGANNNDEAKLSLEREVETMRDAFTEAHGRGDWQHVVEFKHFLFADIQHLVKGLLDIKPVVVHFTCHGKLSALSLYQDPVSVQRLIDAFAALSKQTGGGALQLVVANACHSAHMKRALTARVDFVIGYHEPVKDAAAVKFSKVFYQALGSGRSLRSSFQLATAQAGCNEYCLRGRKDANKFAFTKPKNGFQGRAHLEQRLHDWLQATGSSPAFVLFGLGRSGKSTLARQFADSRNNDIVALRLVFILSAATMDQGYVALLSVLQAERSGGMRAPLSQEAVRHEVHKLLR